MEMGRHTEKAAIKYQERGSCEARRALGYMNFESVISLAHSIYHQRSSAIEYATARKLMGVEE